MEPKELKNSEELHEASKATPVTGDTENVAENTPPETVPVKHESEGEAAGAETSPEQAKSETVSDSKQEKKTEEPQTPVKEMPAAEATKTVEKEKKERQVEKKAAEKAVDKSPKEKEDKTEPISLTESPDSEVQTGEVAAEAGQKQQKEEKKESVASKIETIEKPVKTAEKIEPAEKTELTAQQQAVIEKEKKKNEGPDYSKYSAVELINALRNVLDNPDKYDLKAEVDAIKSAFFKQKNDQIELDKIAFIEEGGAESDFVAEENPYEQDIKDLLKRYRQLKIEYNKKLDLEKEENLKKKYEVIEKIKNLVNTEESINKTFNEFKELQNEWREIGPVPQSKMKNLWDLYHFHVENFYDYIKINRELRDLDLKRNLEMKINLCEQAEELLLEPSIIRAFNQLQKLHEQWREIGPVPRENKDDIWERFKTVTAKINKKHQEFFENRKNEQKKNLEAKIALCEKAEEICNQEIDGFREWDEKSKELVELQKVWRTIGFAPKKDNNKIYERFRTACDSFFDRKREFYSKSKEEQQNNLQLKIQLCELAESLKDSTDWKKTTQEFINIQKQWKEIGPVPRKQSDAVWKRFRAACDYFFDKKSEHFSDVDSEHTDNLKLKEDLIAEVENFKSTGDVDKNLNSLKEFQRRWTEIGHVPFKKKDDIQNRFRQAINKLYDELNIDEEKRNLLRFRSKMSTFTETNRGQNKIRFEREKYMNKLKQLENDLVLLDNNIGFFTKSKNAESLIKDVKKKIEVTKRKIETLKEKIRVIDELENQ